MGGARRAVVEGQLPGLPPPARPPKPLVGGAGPGASPAWAAIPGVEAETVPGGLEVVWCTGTDADAFLMRAAGLLRKQGAPAVVVASSDGEVQDASLRPSDGVSYSPALAFLREVRWAIAQSDAAVAAAAALTRNRLTVPGLRASVRPAVAGALSDLRRRLMEEAVAGQQAAGVVVGPEIGVGGRDRRRKKARAKAVAQAAGGGGDLLASATMIPDTQVAEQLGDGGGGSGGGGGDPVGAEEGRVEEQQC